MPQPLQLSESVAKSISRPSPPMVWRSPLQSPNVPAQVLVQAPPAQLGLGFCVGDCWPRPPQLPALVAVSVSQPSPPRVLRSLLQSPKPELQLSLQRPPTQA